MVTTALVSVSEYLSSSYEVDCDYVDGELQERNVGERPHSAVQYILSEIFNRNGREWKVVAFAEQRVQVSPTRYRIPDVCVLRRSDPVENIVRTSPLVCIEVLSPEDRMHRTMDRVEDYRAMGVRNIWIIDPFKRRVWNVLEDGTQQPVSEALCVSDSPIRIDLGEVWSRLNEMQTRD